MATLAQWIECDGLLPHKCNKYRVRHGLAPLPDPQHADVQQRIADHKKKQAGAEITASTSTNDNPGDELKAILQKVGLTPSTGCQCNSKMLAMNQWGVKGCEERIDEIAAWLQKAAAHQSRKSVLKAAWNAVTHGVWVNPLDPYRGLVERAISAAKRSTVAACESDTSKTISGTGRGAARPHQRRRRDQQSNGNPREGLARQRRVNRPFQFDRQEQTQFITSSRLMEDAKLLASKLPANTSSIIGIARSGVSVATMVSMLLHRPLFILRQSTHDIVLAGNGWRLTGEISSQGPAVVIDDTVMTGNSLKDVLPVVRKAYSEFVTAAVYVNPAAHHKPDIWVHDLPWPHLLEWNLFNSVLTPHLACDFDGILCQDCPMDADDDSHQYAGFLQNATPLYVVRKAAIPLIVTARLEKYRPQTLEWLTRHGMSVKQLVMGPWQSKSERSQSDIAAFKASHYSRFLKQRHAIKPPLFIESDPRQAQRIAELAKGLVVCPAVGKVFG